MPQADRNAAIATTVVGLGIIATAVIISVANKSGQISKHIAANTPVDTTPAYSLIHTGGPRPVEIPSAPPNNAYLSPYCTTPNDPYIYGDAHYPSQPYSVPQDTPYPPVGPSYPIPTYPIAIAVDSDNTMDTIDYKHPCPKSGKTIKILCPEQPQTRRNIRYIQFNNGTDIYELNGDIRPNSTSTFTDKYGNAHRIKWINPRARQ